MSPGMWGPPRPGDRNCDPCIGRQSLNHWIIREVHTPTLNSIFGSKTLWPHTQRPWAMVVMNSHKRLFPLCPEQAHGRSPGWLSPPHSEFTFHSPKGIAFQDTSFSAQASHQPPLLGGPATVSLPGGSRMLHLYLNTEFLSSRGGTVPGAPHPLCRRDTPFPTRLGSPQGVCPWLSGL